MLVDCDGCAARGVGCHDCVVTVLLGPPRAPVELGEAERLALAVLADGGLVPPLRLVAVDPAGERREGGAPRRAGSEVAHERCQHVAS